MPTPKPTNSSSASDLIKLALGAGFLELAYAMLVIAIATLGLAATQAAKGTPILIFQYAMSALGVCAAIYILIDLLRRGATSMFSNAKGASPSA